MKYNIIYADPPWTYDDKALNGNRGACCKYDLMSLAALKALEVPSADDCILFLWVTMPKLPDSLELIGAWGFTFKTTAFVWVKTNPKSGTPFFGMGRWTRSNAEMVLLATKGHPKRVSAGVSQILCAEQPDTLESPILKPHSRKPNEIRERIVTLCGDVPRLEMFAREASPGWDVFGNQVENSIDITKGDC
jgi:N6-adenosine-specific RNA methylase IME4